MAMAAALYGTVLGSLLGGWPTDRFGRKKTLLFIGLLYVLSAVGCGYAWDVTSFVVARFIGGLGIGISTVAAPLYISEIAPPAYRGRLAGMFQFNIVFGILVAFASNAALAGIGENAWRWMLGVAAFPSLLYTVLCFGLPESPRWLIGRKGDRTAGLKVLKLIEPEASEAQLEAHADEILGGFFRASGLLAFLELEDARPDSAGIPRRVLQSTLRHQRDSLLCAAHFRPHRQRKCHGAIGRHRVHEPGLHVCGPLADRPTRAAHAAFYRLFRLYPLAGAVRAGVLYLGAAVQGCVGGGGSQVCRG